jgi:hypothetical protein
MTVGGKMLGLERRASQVKVAWMWREMRIDLNILYKQCNPVHSTHLSNLILSKEHSTTPQTSTA